MDIPDRTSRPAAVHITPSIGAKTGSEVRDTDGCPSGFLTYATPRGTQDVDIAEDLATFKVLSSRDKDWRDLHEMLLAQGPDFDSAYVATWLERILAPDDARLARFRAIVAERNAG